MDSIETRENRIQEEIRNLQKEYEDLGNRTSQISNVVQKRHADAKSSIAISDTSRQLEAFTTRLALMDYAMGHIETTLKRLEQDKEALIKHWAERYAQITPKQ